MSRDVVAALVLEGHKWRHDLMEDVAMSELAQECGFELGHGTACSIERNLTDWFVIAYNGKQPGFTFTDFADLNRLDDQFFFRVKCDSDRSRDAKIMHLLKTHLIP